MVSAPAIILIVVGILILVVLILVLPKSIAGRISGAAIALGLILTGIGLWMTASTEARTIQEHDIEKSNEYSIDIYKTFLQIPSLAPMYEQIYGNEIPSREHA